MDKKKKMAAALAAVTNYIKSEQEAQVAAQLAAIPVEPRVPSAGGAWPLSGRQSQMQMRNMMQMKSFHGVKLR